MDRNGEQRGRLYPGLLWPCPSFGRTLLAMMVLACTLYAGLGQEPVAGETVSGAHPASLQVTLVVGAESRTLSTTVGSVAELLVQEQVELGDWDRVCPALDHVLCQDALVKVTRVNRRLVITHQAIAPGSRVRFDPRVAGRVVLSHGRSGLRRLTYQVWEADGKETSRSLVASHLVRAPGTQTVLVGNQPALVSRGGQPLIMVATAYDPGPRSCGRFASGHTAIGAHATRGVAAVDPNVIPLGTRLYVEGYGPALAADVGGAIKGRRIDVCFDTYRQALSWGRRTVRVYVLE